MKATAAKSDFHKAPKAWSQIKHQILGNYLSLFLGKLGLTRRPVYYVDGFAGPGRLEDGSEGSPLLAARLATEPRQKSRAGLLHCINVEAVASTFANLEQVTAPYVKGGLVANHHGRFEDLLPKILRSIGDATAFFFIDPFGTKGAEIETLKCIASRTGKSEVLVRYDDTRVKRLISWAANNLEHFDETHRKIAQRMKARVDQLTDEEAASDTELALLFGTEVETRDWLIAGYERQVKAQTKFTYSLSYPIRNPLTGGHRYYLVHFCSHPDGYTHMANFMAQAERTYRKLASGTGDLFHTGQEQMEFLVIRKEFAEKEELELVGAIKERLPEIIKARRLHGKGVENRELYAAIVECFGWKVIRGEYIKALREFEKAGKIRMAGTNDNDYTHLA
jgi:three-Cys-motif partner protein